MTNLYEFLIVVSPSARVHLNNDDFAGHLCQTINNVVKQDQSASILSLLRKRRPPQLDQALEYFAYMLLTNLENYTLLDVWYGSQTVARYLIEE